MKPGSDHSDEKAHRIAYLIAGYIRKTLSMEEHDELDAWVEASDENMKLFEDLTDETNIEANLAWMDGVQTEKALEQVKTKLTFAQEEAVTVERRSRSWWPYVAAASVVIAIAAYFLLKSGTASKTDKEPNVIATDVMPGGNKATLTLSDGSVIDLTAAGQGTLKEDGGATIRKPEEGLLTYSNTSGTSTPSMNTLSTPTGGQYALTLSDGTKVWLNAASSLTYPAFFNGNERVVELNGEGYFEVAKNKEKPFIVQLPDGNRIKVLGTHFNALTYGDEAAQQITLVEGSVQVRSGADSQLLKPGQQALIKESIVLNRKADLQQALGWKEGEFFFRDADIPSIMRQVKRWYGVEVVLQTTSSEHFNARVDRNAPLSKLLHYLELTKRIHFKIENNIVYVLP